MTELSITPGDMHAGDDTLRALMQRDRLTGCVARAGFELWLAQRRRDNVLAVPVALIELYGLAHVNDADGRDSGDGLLATIGRRLDRLARLELGPAVLVARIDGARFAVLAPQGTAVERLRVEAHAMVAALDEYMPKATVEPVELRLSVGSIAQGENSGDAMGRIARRLAAAPGIVRAIDIEAAARGEGINVLFQPQFEMDGDRLIGAEALVRWSHPRLGELGGAALFAAAQGSERALSRAVIEATLQAMALWPEPLAKLRIAINLTAADVADPMMADELISMATRAAISAGRLAIEVTEAAAIACIDTAAETLSQLRAMGIEVALDDFGTGHSGLAWLRRLPVDYIKIDSGFARDVEGAARDRAVLQGVVDLARALDLGVLAEGVETEAQRSHLAAMGCQWYQGYLRSPALPSAAFVDYALARV